MKQEITQYVIFSAIVAVSLAFLEPSAAELPKELPGVSKDGAAVRTPNSPAGFFVLDAEKNSWLEPEAFWTSFVARHGGYTWESSADFPDYDKVKEHDTFLVQTEQGPCLMYFFHTRWRRARDVWRWSQLLNEYAGCKTVFD